MTHLRILMGARRRGILNRVGTQTSLSWTLLLALFVALMGGLLLLGHAAAPGLLRPPMDLVTAIGMNTPGGKLPAGAAARSEEHTSELQSRPHLVCRLLL